MQNVWNKPPLPKEDGFYWICTPSYQMEGKPPTEHSKPNMKLIEVIGSSTYITGSDEGGGVHWYADAHWIKIEPPVPSDLPPTIRKAESWDDSITTIYVACTVMRP